MTTTDLEQETSSAKGAKIGMDKTANPVEDCMKMPSKMKTMNINIPKIILGNPEIALLNELIIVSNIFPSSKVILIPLAMPLIIATPAKSPAPFIKASIAFCSPFPFSFSK